MKNLLKIAGIVAAVVLSFSSCKKTYECHCDKIGGGDDHFEFKEKEADAESKCKAKQTASPTVYSKCMLE